MKTRGAVTKETLILILVALFVCALLFGGLGAPHAWGVWGWGPAGLLIVVFLLVLLLG
ncbi:MAG TPA: hypothetical protein VGI97_00685 [Gemmatimonadaceae bacterium]|jgi:hypothetical protein